MTFRHHAAAFLVFTTISIGVTTVASAQTTNATTSPSDTTSALIALYQQLVILLTNELAALQQAQASSSVVTPTPISTSTPDVSNIVDSTWPAPTCTISVFPASIVPGGSASLRWTSEYATDATIQPGAIKGALGVLTVSPTYPTLYSVVVHGPSGYGYCSTTLGIVSSNAQTVTIPLSTLQNSSAF